MATNRPTTVRRVPWYMGPSGEMNPAKLNDYDNQLGWLAQQKHDGMWAMLTVGRPAEGRPNVFKSRDARTPACSGSGVEGLADFTLNLPEGTILVGELGAVSQADREAQFARLGHRTFHVFDVVRFGEEQDLRDKTTRERLMTLEGMMIAVHQDPAAVARFVLVETHFFGFAALYERVMAENGEGVVLKRCDSLYRTTRSDGKTDQWLRCKKLLTDDYVLIGFAMTPGGKTSAPQKTGVWGLWDSTKNKYVPVLKSGTADNASLLVDENVGRLVAEFKGYERFSSGALRHAGFVRTRPDKQPGECVLR